MVLLRKVRWCPIGTQPKFRINGGIRVPSVRLIDESNVQVGIVVTEEALRRARDIGLDLVEVSPNSDPPVCRIMDYGKWLYQQKRKVREAHKKHPHAGGGTLKEIRLKLETDKHDVEIKQNHAREFLEKGHKVQFTLRFRGRQMLHRDQGYVMMDQIAQSLLEVAKVENRPQMSGGRMTLTVIPK